MYAVKLIPTEMAGIKQIEGTLIVGKDRFTMFGDDHKSTLQTLIRVCHEAITAGDSL